MIDKNNQTRFFNQLDGSSYEVPINKCRGCWMNENLDKIPRLVQSVWEDDDISVRQDIEWPIPAFYIVSPKEHISSIMHMNSEVYKKFFTIIKIVRSGLYDLFGIERAQIYHEEKINNPHVHFWILPLWTEVLEINDIRPKIYDGNVKQYIDLFKYADEKDKIEHCNAMMREYLNKIIV